jgi:hypothetical protein
MTVSQRNILISTYTENNFVWLPGAIAAPGDPSLTGMAHFV